MRKAVWVLGVETALQGTCGVCEASFTSCLGIVTVSSAPSRRGRKLALLSSKPGTLGKAFLIWKGVIMLLTSRLLLMLQNVAGIILGLDTSMHKTGEFQSKHTLIFLPSVPQMPQALASVNLSFSCIYYPNCFEFLKGVMNTIGP